MLHTLLILLLSGAAGNPTEGSGEPPIAPAEAVGEGSGVPEGSGEVGDDGVLDLDEVMIDAEIEQPEVDFILAPTDLEIEPFSPYSPLDTDEE